MTKQEKQDLDSDRIAKGYALDASYQQFKQDQCREVDFLDAMHAYSEAAAKCPWYLLEKGE